MEDKINKTIAYYTYKSNEIISFVNSNKNLTIEQIIESGEQLSIFRI